MWKMFREWSRKWAARRYMMKSWRFFKWSTLPIENRFLTFSWSDPRVGSTHMLGTYVRCMSFISLLDGTITIVSVFYCLQCPLYVHIPGIRNWTMALAAWIIRINNILLRSKCSSSSRSSWARIRDGEIFANGIRLLDLTNDCTYVPTCILCCNILILLLL